MHYRGFNDASVLSFSLLLCVRSHLVGLSATSPGEKKRDILESMLSGWMFAIAICTSCSACFCSGRFAFNIFIRYGAISLCMKQRTIMNFFN